MNMYVLLINSQATYLTNTCILPFGAFLTKTGLNHFPLNILQGTIRKEVASSIRLYYN